MPQRNHNVGNSVVIWWDLKCKPCVIFSIIDFSMFMIHRETGQWAPASSRRLSDGLCVHICSLPLDYVKTFPYVPLVICFFSLCSTSDKLFSSYLHRRIFIPFLFFFFLFFRSFLLSFFPSLLLSPYRCLVSITEITHQVAHQTKQLSNHGPCKPRRASFSSGSLRLLIQSANMT